MSEDYIRLPYKNWQPVCKTMWHEEWKDFRMSVCRTHTWFGEHETCYEVIEAFHAWRNQNQEDTPMEERDHLLDVIDVMGTLLDKYKGSRDMKKNQEEADTDNVINMEEARLALASKEPPTGGNWLSSLTQGTRFLAFKKREQTPFLEDFMVGTDPKQMSAILLGYELNHRDGGWKWCDPIKFSRDYGLFMTIKAEKSDDGNSVSEGTVEGDGRCQIIPPLHEE